MNFYLPDLILKIIIFLCGTVCIALGSILISFVIHGWNTTWLL